ncbi:MAG: hypothetical protein J6O41_01640 [Clostridia bacterium]|nr:hypothetical protein [Clostridia bacterium]
MDRLKTFLKYALWLIGFFILSDILINVGLNSSYHDMKRKDELNQVTVYQAQSTKVNGRIRGVIDNANKDLAGKYLEVDLYSKRDVYLGKKYFEINSENENILFEMFFKMEDVSSYEIKIVDEKEPGGELQLLPKDMNKSEILVVTLFTLLIFW